MIARSLTLTAPRLTTLRQVRDGWVSLEEPPPELVELITCGLVRLDRASASRWGWRYAELTPAGAALLAEMERPGR